MSDGRRRPWPLSADLAFVLGLVGLTALTVFLPELRDTPLRIVLGFAFGLFAPGYAFVAALFPGARKRFVDGPPGEVEVGDARSLGRGIDGTTRVVLSFGLSAIVVPAIGLVLNFTPWGIRPFPVVVAVSGFTVVCTAVAARRRMKLPESERFAVRYREWLAAGRRGLLGRDTNAGKTVKLLLVASVLLALGSVGYAATVPDQGEQFTQFYILTQNESGDLVADDYPSELTAGEPEPLYVGIENEEYATSEYTVVVQLQRVDVKDGEAAVLERARIDRFTVTLSNDETHLEERRLTAPSRLTGEDLRLAFLLYEGEAPSTPTADDSHRTLHLWVDVEES